LRNGTTAGAVCLGMINHQSLPSELGSKKKKQAQLTLLIVNDES
jgi:hypothetical protein